MLWLSSLIINLAVDWLCGWLQLQFCFYFCKCRNVIFVAGVHISQVFSLLNSCLHLTFALILIIIVLMWILPVGKGARAMFSVDDVVLLSAVTPCYCSMLSALSRVESFEACCQWALLSVQRTRLVTLPYYCSYCTEVDLSICQ